MDSKLFKKRARLVLKGYAKEELGRIDLDNPTIDDIISIAEMGNVTTDWLLGVDTGDVVDKILKSRKIHDCVDQCAGKEIEDFAKWSKNWINDTYTRAQLEQLYYMYRSKKRLTKSERKMVDIIQKEAVLTVLCPNK